MVYSDTSTKQGIVEDFRYKVNDGASAISINDITRLANRALDRVAFLIQTSDGRWQWDDQNNSDLPIATTDLVANQQDYSIDQTFLRITRVECVNQYGTFNYLIPIDQNDLNNAITTNANPLIPQSQYNQGLALTEFLKTPGNPIYYDKIGNSIFLYPKPSFNYTGGLKVYYERNMNYFATTDTTKAPGFNPQFHGLIATIMARDYSMTKLPEKVEQFEREILKLEDSLQEFYQKRNADEPIKIVPRVTNYK